MVTVTGTVGPSGKYLFSGMPVTTGVNTTLKIVFENNTAGANLELCAGTPANFAAGTAGIVLSDSGGPGFQFLTIVDTAHLAGLVLYVLRAVGSIDASFTLIVD
jgi:hypothetical protein